MGLIVKSNFKKFMKEYKEKKSAKTNDNEGGKDNDDGEDAVSHTTDTSTQDDAIVNAANFVVTAETNSKNFLLNARDKLKKAVSSKKLDNKSSTNVDSKKSNKVDAVESEQQKPLQKSSDNAMVVPTNQ